MRSTPPPCGSRLIRFSGRWPSEPQLVRIRCWSFSVSLRVERCSGLLVSFSQCHPPLSSELPWQSSMMNLRLQIAIVNDPWSSWSATSPLREIGSASAPASAIISKLWRAVANDITWSRDDAGVRPSRPGTRLGRSSSEAPAPDRGRSRTPRSIHRTCDFRR